MWVALPLLCAGALLLGAPACSATDLSVSSLGTTRGVRGCEPRAGEAVSEPPWDPWGLRVGVAGPGLEVRPGTGLEGSLACAQTRWAARTPRHSGEDFSLPGGAGGGAGAEPHARTAAATCWWCKCDWGALCLVWARLAACTGCSWRPFLGAGPGWALTDHLALSARSGEPQSPVLAETLQTPSSVLRPRLPPCGTDTGPQNFWEGAHPALPGLVVFADLDLRTRQPSTRSDHRGTNPERGRPCATPATH